MRTKICPICDQKVKGMYCKNCHKLIKPVVYESTFRLNESSTGKDYLEIQLEDRGRREANKCYTAHAAPNVPDEDTVIREPNKCYTSHAAPNAPDRDTVIREPNRSYSSQPAAGQQKNRANRQSVSGYGSETKKNNKSARVLIVVFIILVLVQFVIPMLIGIFSMAGSTFDDISLEEVFPEESYFDEAITEDGWEEDELITEPIGLEEAKEYGDSSTGLVTLDIPAETLLSAQLKLLREQVGDIEENRYEDYYKSVNRKTREVLTYCSVYHDVLISNEEYYMLQEDALNGRTVSVSFTVKDLELAERLAAAVLMESEGIGEEEAREFLDISEERMEVYYTVAYNDVSVFGYSDGEDGYTFLISSERY